MSSRPVSREMSSRLVLNVGGRRFETRRATLSNVPNTRLARLVERERDGADTGEEEKGEGSGHPEEHFFDRNPDFFDPILDFYRHGELHFPHSLCGASVKRELMYWGIDEYCISSCCWNAYKKTEEDTKKIIQLERALHDPETWPERPILQGKTNRVASVRAVNVLGAPEADETARARWGECKAALWAFLDKPQTSFLAMVWAFFVSFLILLSILIVVMETHPWFRVTTDVTTYSNATYINYTNPKVRLYAETSLHPALDVIDGFCIVVFTIELALRLVACPSKMAFFKSGYNLIDVMCVLPRAVFYVIHHVSSDAFTRDVTEAGGGGGSFVFVMIYSSLSSVLRVFRLIKLARHYSALKIMILAVKSSIRELSLLLILISMGTLIFSTLIYFAEFDVDGSFPHIPIGLWWSTITMTTVGYGDYYPRAGLGYLVGITCAISGMLITGLPIPIIANNLNHYYTYARMSAKIHEKLRAERVVWRAAPAPSSGPSADKAPSLSTSTLSTSTLSTYDRSTSTLSAYDRSNSARSSASSFTKRTPTGVARLVKSTPVKGFAE